MKNAFVCVHFLTFSLEAEAKCLLKILREVLVRLASLSATYTQRITIFTFEKNISIFVKAPFSNSSS